jgi:hypothetical protein
VAGPRADAGLAELVNAQFYSRNTISNTGGYPSPFVPPDCDEVEFGAGTGATWVSELPERGEDGELIDPAGREKFLSSHLVPHLARCNFHNVPIKRRRTRDEQKRLSYSVADDSVRWDYLEILFPLTVKYTAELMDAYFTPRLDVVPLPQNRFKLVNPSPYDLSFDVSAVEIAYDGVDPGSGDILRQIVPADCSHDGSGSGPAVLLAGPEPGQPGPAGNFTCDMPQTLDVPADKRGAFLVLVRGQLGSRGDVGTPAEFDSGAKDYVLAFQQVFGWQVSAHSTDLRPVGAPREFDEDVITEVWTIAFDLEGALAGEEPKFVAVNRSARLRQQLALTLGGEIDRVDFSSPSTEPEGTRIAFGGDVNDDSGVVGFVDPSEFYIVDLLEPSVFFQIPLPGLIPITNQEGGPKWDFDPSRDAIFYSANETGSALGEAFIVRYDVDANSSVASTMTDRLVVDSVFGNRIVALHPNLIQGPDLLLADPVTGERTHRFNMDLMTVEECEGSCLLHDSLPQGEASFSPDGNRVAFAHRPEGETNSRLYIADLTNLSGGVAPISQLGSATGVEEVAWSPDGDWIAYFSPGADGILVISAEGGDPVLVSPFGGRSIAWRPPLLLPE